MILDNLDTELNGDSWEKLCHACYRDKYSNQHYTEIPATVGGDAGIEGFTRTGVAIQCYCAERNYSDNELYEHQRDKMTKDIGKLLSTDYRKRLKNLGVPPIKEWHFVVPFYKDSRILQHAQAKKKEVLDKKDEDSKIYDHIDADFDIIVKQAEDLRIQITRLIRTSIADEEVNLVIRNIEQIDWSNCDSDKVDNIKMKVKAVVDDEIEEEDFNELVNIYVQAYMHGLATYNDLRVSWSEIYEDIYALEQSCKKEVKMKTMMNSNSSMNKNILFEIMKDFEKNLEETCSYLNTASINILKIDIISMWLADCSMKFRK